jgi:hypothetical protein
MAAIADAEREVALRERCGASYGYAFYLLAG